MLFRILNNKLFMGIALSLIPAVALAAWTNRYKKVEDYGHHIYLEQHEFPFLSAGPVDPAASPDGKQLAFAAQGWLWLLNLESGVATQLTEGAELDGRPRWSADGKQLAFVRDAGTDTRIVLLDLKRNKETVINTAAIELDPEFSADGQYLYFTSARSGFLNLWRRDLASGTDEELTTLPRTERSPRRVGNTDQMMYVHQAYPHRTFRLYDDAIKEDRIVRSNMLVDATAFDVHPDGHSIVFNHPTRDDYHVYVADITRPDTPRQLTIGTGYALMPTFSAAGDSLYYVTPDANQQFHLMRVATSGGAPEEVVISEWRGKDTPGRLNIITLDASGKPVPARLSVRRDDGHALASDKGPNYLDSENGYHYFYSDGDITLPLPAGKYTVTAARGPMSIPAKQTVKVKARREAKTKLQIKTVWDAKAAGYVSADQHVHLNADGAYRFTLEGALPLLAGEDLDQLSTMSWNKYNRYLDQDILGDQARSNGDKLVVQSQEVRSGFHGHIGLIGNKEAFFPWFFGPRTPHYGREDRSNAEVIQFAAERDVLATYVHPMNYAADPFDDFDANPIPMELISDGILSDEMGIELVCAWTHPLGNAAVWYRLLNIGKPIYATSGTDAFADFQRTPAMGTARLYTQTDDAENTLDAVMEKARTGQSFLTTGPALLFAIGEDVQPGGVVDAGQQSWTLTLASSEPVTTVEIIVNGEIVETLDGIDAGETQRYSGTVTLPEGGWVAARAHGGGGKWPSMAADQFAHSSPIWIEAIGSIDADAASEAAQDLLNAVDYAEAYAKKGYGDRDVSSLMKRFEDAREVLETYRKP